MPLKALNQGKEVYSWNMSEADRERKFKCHICNDEMVLVHGSKVMTHFRHKNKRAINQEPESIEHLTMKKKVYDTLDLMSNSFDVKNIDLEHLVESEDYKNITDVYCELNTGKLYIECQCSSLEYNDFFKRNLNYLSDQNDTLIWILGGKYTKNLFDKSKYENRYDKPVQQISEIEKKILNQHGCLYYYDKNNNCFYEATFKYKFRRGSDGYCDRLGWYQKRRINLSTILERYIQ